MVGIDQMKGVLEDGRRRQGRGGVGQDEWRAGGCKEEAGEGRGWAEHGGGACLS